MEESIVISNTAADRRELKLLQSFWLGFIVYTLAFVVSAATENYNLWNLVQIIGLLLCMPAAAYLIKFKIENPYLRLIYSLYYIWAFIIIFRGAPFDIPQIRSMLFDAWYGIFLYFVPLIMLFPKNVAHLKKVFDVIVILGVAFILLDAMYYKLLMDPDRENLVSQGLSEYFTKTLSIPCGFILLTYRYHTKRRNFFAIGVVLLTLLVAAIRARRGIIFMTSSMILCSYLLFLYSNRKNLLSIIFSFFLLAGLGVYLVKLYTENSNGIFSMITERADEDTRSEVETFFYNDMKQKDWLIGKGVNGEYFCPGVDGDGYTNYRTVIETDYLNIILKGGFVNLGLLLLILVPAIFQGLFFSKNILSKAAAIWILLWIVDLYPATVTTFTLNYLLVWIATAICYSKLIRKMPDNEIGELLR